MGLLNGGLARVFASAFASIYLPATLHTPSDTDDGKGTVARTFADAPVRAQADAVTWAMRQAGYTDADARLLILTAGAPPVTTECQVTVKGLRYAIKAVALDPAGAVYDCAAERA